MNSTRRDFTKLDLLWAGGPISSPGFRGVSSRHHSTWRKIGDYNGLPESAPGSLGRGPPRHHCRRVRTTRMRECRAGGRFFGSRLARCRSWWPGAERNHYGISGIARTTARVEGFHCRAGPRAGSPQEIRRCRNQSLLYVRHFCRLCYRCGNRCDVSADAGIAD